MNEADMFSNKFLSWWPVIVAVLIFATTIGGQQVTIAGQDDRLVEQKVEISENKNAIVALKTVQAKIDERTKNIQMQQSHAQSTLDTILKELRTR